MSSDDPQANEPLPTDAVRAERMSGRYDPVARPGDPPHEARDRVLDRAVRIRSVDAAGADALEREARFLARLEHPGVVPVHDFIRDADGAMLVESVVEGVSLAAAMAEARQGAIRPELASPGAAVLLAKRVCDALAAAHAKQVVHRRLTPEAIILGWHGKVVVQGWEKAVEEAERPATMRFVAQAQSPRIIALDDLHTDVRAVGRCLFSALVWSEFPAGEWRLDEDERARMPPQLEAVIRYAVTSDRTLGYRSIEELGDDLAQYLHGVAPSAYRPGGWIRMRGWMAGHPGLTAAGVLLLVGACTAGAAALLLARHAREAWGPPVVEETFADESWRTRWIEDSKGAFSIENGKLVTQAPRHANLIFRQRLTTPVAIEYTGQILPGSAPCDLSVVWSERDALPETPNRFTTNSRAYLIQAGAHDNAFCGIIQIPLYLRVAHADRQLEVGRDYRFRVEIDGQRISMSIDGQQVYEYRDVFPSASGYLALYGYYPGKAFDDIRIVQKEPPASVPVIATADTLFQFRHFADAAAAYGRIVDSDRDGESGQLARFRKGLAEIELGRTDESRTTWAGLTDAHLRNLADCRRLEDLLETWQTDLLMSRFEEWYVQRPDVRDDLHLSWQILLGKIKADPRADEAVVLRFIELRERLFPGHSASAGAAAGTLLTIGRYKDILQRYPGEHVSCNEARFALGLLNEMRDAKGAIRRDSARIHVMRGEFDKVFQVPGVGSESVAYAMCKLGRGEDALRTTSETYPTLIHLGRADELLQSFYTRSGTVDFQTNECLIAMGKYAEAAGPGWPGLPRTGMSIRGCILLGRFDDADKLRISANHWHRPMTTGWARLLAAAEAGQKELVARWRPSVGPPANLSWPAGWFAGVVVGPFVDRLGGESGALHKSLEHAILTYPNVFARNAWFLSSYVLGRIGDAELLAMPSASESEAWLAVAKGLRAELEERPADALAAYRAYADLPSHRRLLDGTTLDVQVELFVAWRLRALSPR
ncbi:MAG: hypothetical protein J0M02_02425 [Planctomycetes bacterium]|nr:hypothetical protein [Planctomycetota bacterium]